MFGKILNEKYSTLVKAGVWLINTFEWIAVRNEIQGQTNKRCGDNTEEQGGIKANARCDELLDEDLWGLTGMEHISGAKVESQPLIMKNSNSREVHNKITSLNRL